MVSITFEQINDLEEHLCSAMLNGEEKITSELKNFVPKDQIVTCKNNILRNLTESYKNGKTPFCQLVAAAQAAAVLYDDSMPPVVCCGAVKGIANAAEPDPQKRTYRERDLATGRQNKRGHSAGETAGRNELSSFSFFLSFIAFKFLTVKHHRF